MVVLLGHLVVLVVFILHFPLLFGFPYTGREGEALNEYLKTTFRTDERFEAQVRWMQAHK